MLRVRVSWDCYPIEVFAHVMGVWLGIAWRWSTRQYLSQTVDFLGDVYQAHRVKYPSPRKFQMDVML